MALKKEIPRNSLLTASPIVSRDLKCYSFSDIKFKMNLFFISEITLTQ